MPLDLADTDAETVPPGGAATQLVTGLAQAAVEAREQLARGATVGRFVVLARLGAGGMGVVYAAYDPELDRKLALKLLAPGLRRRADVRGRVLREAQAMARLQHPNIVAVHDVGVRDDQVWIAMEFIDGETLGAWLKRHRRGWREVLAVLEGAARGLAAAHAAGLVHRDVKPDNVMLSAGGRVRLMDFGLVSARGVEDAPVPDDALEVSRSGVARDLTQAGAVMGTPAYMAPEQHLGHVVDARADQFSFCVTAWEALYRQRPFPDEDPRMTVAAVVAGVLRRPPRGEVPGWLRRVLERGLQPDPERRFADMDALMGALRRGRVRARWWRVVALLSASLAIAGLVLVGAGLQRRSTVQACEAGGAAIHGLWSRERRDAVERAFAATGQPHAASSFERVSAHFDEYVEEWQRRRMELCARAEVEREVAAADAAAMAACLDDRRTALGDLIDHFSASDVAVVTASVSAAWNLPSLSGCGEAAELSRFRDQDEPALRARATALRRELVAISTMVAVGKTREGLAKVAATRPEAEALGLPGPLVELGVLESAIRDRLGEYPRAEATLRQTLWLAFGAGLDDHVARLAARLVFAVGYRQGRPDEAMQWADLGEAALRRRGGGLPGDRATLLAALAAVHGVALRTREELRLSEEALALEAAAEGADHPNVAIYSSNLGRTYLDAGELDAAEALLDRAVTVLDRTFGPTHLTSGLALMNRGLVDLRRGAYDEAWELLGASWRRLAGAHGAARVEAAYAGFLAADALVQAGRADEAREVLDAIPPNPAPNIEGMRLRLSARLAADDGDLAGALAQATAACPLSDDPEDLALCKVLLGDIHLRRGDVPQARASYEAAIAAAEPGLGPTGPVLAEALTGLGEARLELDGPGAARPLLARARALAGARALEPRGEARTLFALARLREREGDVTGARVLADEARTLLCERGPSRAQLRDEVERWLGLRGAPPI